VTSESKGKAKDVIKITVSLTTPYLFLKEYFSKSFKLLYVYALPHDEREVDVVLYV
jgi:hypothetical protein